MVTIPMQKAKKTWIKNLVWEWSTEEIMDESDKESYICEIREKSVALK